jgi:hypothetical protein
MRERLPDALVPGTWVLKRNLDVARAAGEHSTHITDTEMRAEEGVVGINTTSAHLRGGVDML